MVQKVSLLHHGRLIHTQAICAYGYPWTTLEKRDESIALTRVASGGNDQAIVHQVNHPYPLLAIGPLKCAGEKFVATIEFLCYMLLTSAGVDTVGGVIPLTTSPPPPSDDDYDYDLPV